MNFEKEKEQNQNDESKEMNQNQNMENQLDQQETTLETETNSTSETLEETSFGTISKTIGGEVIEVTTDNRQINPLDIHSELVKEDHLVPVQESTIEPITYATPLEKQMEFAGFWKRFLAYMIDYFILNSVGTIIGLFIGIPLGIFGAASGLTEDEMTFFLFGVYVIILPFSILLGLLYYGICESSKMEGTIGKYALGIKVINKDGSKISFWKAVGRAFAMTISLFTFGVGWIMIAFTDKKQALHDMVAGCYVANKEKK